MSYCQTKFVNLSGDVEDGEMYKNAHGFCAFVWGSLAGKYLPAEMALLGPAGGWRALWDAAEVLPLCDWERNVLGFTYDFALVERGDCISLVRSLRKFAEEYPAGSYVCHLQEVAAEISERLLNDPDWRALGFYGMSCGEDLWSVGYIDPEWGEEVRDYNIFKDTGHWYVDIRDF